MKIATSPFNMNESTIPILIFFAKDISENCSSITEKKFGASLLYNSL